MKKLQQKAVMYTKVKSLLITRAICTLAMLLPLWPVQKQLSARESENNAITAAIADTDDSDNWQGYVTADSLAVKNGLAPEYDEIARLHKGDIVTVREVNRFGWATIAVPAGVYAFIPARYVVEDEEGKQITTVGKVKLLYPTEKDPTKSWKGVLLPDETKLDIVELIKTEEGDFYSVIMPESMNAYIPARYIRRATEEEVKLWLGKNKKDESDEADEADEAEKNVEIQLPDNITADNTPDNDINENIPDQSQTVSDQANAVGSTIENNIIITGSQPATVPDTTADNATGKTITDDNEPIISNDPTHEELADILDNDVTADTPTNETAVDTITTTDIAENMDNTEAVTTVAPLVKESKQITGYLEEPVSWETLDAIYKNLKKIPTMEAEIEPVIDGYKQIIANNTETKQRIQLAEARIAILDIKMDFQRAQQRLNAAIADTQKIKENAAFQYNSLSGSNSVYDAVGIFARSSIYDGRRLPQLYRLLHEKSQRTLLYFIPPTDKFSDSIKIGSLVGVTGEYVSDPARNIKIMLVKQIKIIPDE